MPHSSAASTTRSRSAAPGSPWAGRRNLSPGRIRGFGGAFKADAMYAFGHMIRLENLCARSPPLSGERPSAGLLASAGEDEEARPSRLSGAPGAIRPPDSQRAPWRSTLITNGATDVTLYSFVYPDMSSSNPSSKCTIVALLLWNISSFLFLPKRSTSTASPMATRYTRSKQLSSSR